MKTPKFIALLILINCLFTEISSMEASDKMASPPKPIIMNPDNIETTNPGEVFVLNLSCWDVFKEWFKDHCCNDYRCCYCGHKLNDPTKDCCYHYDELRRGCELDDEDAPF